MPAQPTVVRPSALLRALAGAAAFALAVAAPAALRGQDAPNTARAVRAQQPPRLDGRDDDAAWRAAPVYSGFRGFQPAEDADPRFRTEFRVVYDDRFLYVFVRAFDPNPDSIMHALSRHDVRGASDQIIVFIDGYHDRRSGYDFDINPDGVRREYSISNDGNEDDSWNGVWDAATLVDSLGWTAEIRIPFSQIRYGESASHTFGFGVWRDIERFKERVAWPSFRWSRNGLVSQMGELTGLDGIPASHTMEVTPYVVAKNRSRPTAAPPTGFQRVQEASVGGDLKYGLTPFLTLDATVNPDFGQVEADPATLNLSAFETFVSEKRPFFIEGSGLYQFGLNCSVVNCNSEGLFYSRRIGRSPQLSGQYGDATTATSTPITAAAKLTGRLPGGLAIGLLDAYTPSVGGVANQTIEPRTNYALFRAQQDLRRGSSSFGIIASAVDRSLDRWTRDSLRSSAYVGGIDFRHRFFGDQYQVSGSATASRVSGSAAAIGATQQNAVHFYQRPDGGLGFDPTRTELSGDAEQILVGKYGGGITRFETSYQRISSGYDPNDLGFLLRADLQNWSTWASLQFRTPTWFYKQFNINVNHWDYWTTGGLRLENAYNTNVHINFTNNWWFNAGGTLGQVGTVYCDRCARGGPALRVDQRITPWFGINGDDRYAVVPYVWVNLARSDNGRSSSVNVNPSADVKFSTRLLTNFGVNVTHNIDNTQWYGNETDAAGVTHYTFARLDQQTFSISARVTYAATPTLTVEFYGEPFVSSGTYADVRELSATPRAASYDARFRSYATASPPMGFAYRQLRSNTVVRWEYRPGSTLFVVWQHGRQGSANQSKLRSWDAEYGDLFALHPDNTFLVKLAYWLNR